MPFGLQATKLTVVRGAEALTRKEDFLQYIRDRGTLSRNYVIFISTEAGLRRDEEGATWEPLVFLKGKGSLVECRPFTASTAKHAVSWASERANIQIRVSEHLLNRANGDMRVVRDTLDKLSAFPGEASLRDVDEMFEEIAAQDMLDAIFAMDKKSALAALQDLPTSEYSRMIGLIDARLELAGHVHDLRVSGKNSGEIARSAGNKAFLVPRMLPVAKYYDKGRRLRIRKYLALLDEYSEWGVPDGALEGLISIW